MEKSFKKLAEIKWKLRSEGGCPWDREQTFESMKKEMLDEANEVAEAIDKKDYKNLKEELGDLIGDIVAIIQIAKEKGLFDEKEVLDLNIEKNIRRHPHVFGNEKAETAEDAIRHWKRVKQEEKKNADKKD